MTDRREEILNESFHNDGMEDAQREITTKPYKAVLISMDIYMKERALELIDFAIRHMHGHSVDLETGKVEIKYKGNWLTTEQLFENFL